MENEELRSRNLTLKTGSNQSLIIQEKILETGSRPNTLPSNGQRNGYPTLKTSTDHRARFLTESNPSLGWLGAHRHHSVGEDLFRPELLF